LLPVCQLFHLARTRLALSREALVLQHRGLQALQQFVDGLRGASGPQAREARHAVPRSSVRVDTHVSPQQSTVAAYDATIKMQVPVTCRGLGGRPEKKTDRRCVGAGPF